MTTLISWLTHELFKKTLLVCNISQHKVHFDKDSVYWLYSMLLSCAEETLQYNGFYEFILKLKTEI